MHKFWLCPATRMLWHEVKVLLRLPDNFFDQNIFMGQAIDDADESARVNTIIMLANQFIWKFRDKQDCLTRARLKQHFVEYLEIEKYIAKITERELTFTNQWGEILNRLH